MTTQPTSTTSVHPTAIIGDHPEDKRWLTNKDAITPPEIHPTVRIEAFVSIDAGLDELGERTRIGEDTWIFKHSHVGHNAQVGARCQIATGTIIGGSAVVEDDVKLGLGVIVLPFRTVGEGSEVGAGSIVTRSIPPGQVWCGNPARFLRKVEEATVPYTKRNQ